MLGSCKTLRTPKHTDLAVFTGSQNIIRIRFLSDIFPSSLLTTSKSLLGMLEWSFWGAIAGTIIGHIRNAAGFPSSTWQENIVGTSWESCSMQGDRKQKSRLSLLMKYWILRFNQTGLLRDY